MKTLIVAINIITLSATPGIAADSVFSRVTGDPFLSDTLHSFGCATVDYDRDGLVDIFVANGFGDNNALYHNEGGMEFSSNTGSLVMQDGGDSSCGVWADFDNSGDLDLFVTNYDPPIDILYRNEGGSVFSEWGEPFSADDGKAGVGAAWADMDRDGFVDLFVANTHVSANFAFRNDLGVGFSLVTGLIGDVEGSSTGCSWTDYDLDGDSDLYVANASGQANAFFRNDGEFSFSQVTGFDPSGGNSGSVCWADWDNDGDFDLLVNNYTTRVRHAWENEGRGTMIRVDEGPLVSDQASSTGAAWGDYDNDGDLDLFVANGLGERNSLYRNDGDGLFVAVVDSPPAQDRGRSYSCAWTDFDNDGALDLLVANGGWDGEGSMPAGEDNFLYHNEGNNNAWIVIRLEGTQSNRAAIGAKVRVRATISDREVWQLREVSGGSGYCSQSDLRVHIGLGDATVADLIRVQWPSGVVQELHNTPVKQILSVVEPPRLRYEAPGIVHVASWPGQSFDLEVSSDLVEWVFARSVLNESGSALFVGEPGDLGARYYRVRFESSD